MRVSPDRVAFTRPAPSDERGRGSRQQGGGSRVNHRERGDLRGGRLGGGICRHVSLRDLLGPGDGPGALTWPSESTWRRNRRKAVGSRRWASFGGGGSGGARPGASVRRRQRSF